MKRVNSLFKHNKHGSKDTRNRYHEAMNQFSRWNSQTFSLQKPDNIKSRHIEAFTGYLKDKGLAPSTIRTTLSGIRFTVDLTNSRENLITNDRLDLAQRVTRGPDRAWSKTEIDNMANYAEKLGRRDIADAIVLAQNTGLRIHEVGKIDRAMAEKALRTGEMKIKGKGGLERIVPVNIKAQEILKNRMDTVRRGEKLFCQDRGAKKWMRSVEDFIYNHRPKIQEDLRLDIKEQKYQQELGVREYKTELTYHGLRHTFARCKYEEFRGHGMSEKAARQMTAELLGHGRDEVTRIYTGH